MSKITFVTPERTSDSPRKSDLVGSLCVFKFREFDPECATSYGVQARAIFDLLVVDGPDAGYQEDARAEFGAVARNLASLKPGDMAVGRYVTGTGNAGRTWYGINFTSDPEDLKVAEDAWASLDKPAF